MSNADMNAKKLAWQARLTAAADKVVLTNATGNENLFLPAVRELLAEARAAAALPSDVTAWVRFRSDGGFEGPIMDSDERMCDVRRNSGAWTPLHVGVAPVSPAAAAPLSWRLVVQAIRAVGKEAARRGEMYPQTRDEQDEDRKAEHRVADEIEWYATRGGAVIERLAGWPTHAPAAAAPFQDRVQPWLLECFGPMIAGDREERNHRFLEEALELVQACGCTAHEAHQLVDYTFGRPVGEPMQEVGGVMVTLAALCLANGLDMHSAGETELARISVPETVAKIRAKQAAKPKHSPLAAALPSDAAQAPKARGDHAIWLLEHIVDVHDDAMNNAPDDRCYAEGAWKATLTDVREFLGTPVSHAAAAPSSARETLIADYPEFDIPTYGHHDVLALLDWSKRAREFIDASNTATPAPLAAAGLTEQAVELIDKLMKRYGHEFYVSKDGVNGPTQYDVASKHPLIARAIALLAIAHGDKQ